MKQLFLFICSISLLCSTAQAQASRVKLKVKPPKFTTQWGRLTADTSTVFKEEATQLVAIPFKVLDDKNKPVEIASYSVLFKHNTVTEIDDENGNSTGKTKPTISTKIQTFKTTPLPQLWITILQEEMRKGDEVYIFDILVKRADNKVVFAPPMLLKIQ